MTSEMANKVRCRLADERVQDDFWVINAAGTVEI